MGEILDIDDPAEVLAAAGRSALAGAAAVGQAVQTARQLVVRPGECSVLDEDLNTSLEELRAMVTEFAGATGRLSAATYHQVAFAVPVLAHADVDGGQLLRNTL